MRTFAADLYIRDVLTKKQTIMKRWFLFIAVAFMAVVSVQAQVCNRCGDSGQIQEPCQPCNNTGTWKCEDCQGTGRMECYHCHGSGELKCLQCDGTGKNGDSECYNCGGQKTFRCEACKEHSGQLMCSRCNGEGELHCFHCGGTGWRTWTCPECIAAGRR